MPRYRVRSEKEVEQQMFASLRTPEEAIIGASVSPVATARFERIAERMQFLNRNYKGSNISQLVALIHIKALKKGCLPREVNSLEPKSMLQLPISKILSIGFKAFSSKNASILHSYTEASDLNNKTAELLKYEIESGNLSLKDRVRGALAVHEAIKNGNIKFLQLLVDCGHNFNDDFYYTGPFYTQTILAYAANVFCKKNNIKVLEFLIDHGATLGLYKDVRTCIEEAIGIDLRGVVNRQPAHPELFLEIFRLIGCKRGQSIEGATEICINFHQY